MLIDFHTHAFPDKLAPKALSSLGGAIHLEPETNGTVDGLLSHMKSSGVDRAVVCNIATNARQNTNVNKFALETLQNHGDSIIPLGSIHPDFPEPESELRMLRENGIRGIKIHPDYMGRFIDDPCFDLIFDLCAEMGMFIIIHAGFDVYSPDKIHADPDRILTRLKRSPRTKLVCAHFGGNNLWNEVEEKLMGKNIWIDTSLGTVYNLPNEQAARMLGKHDPEKILFGSDCPWCSEKVTFEYVDSLPLGDDLKEKIYSKNALALLGE